MLFHISSQNGHGLVWARSRQQALYAYRDETKERGDYRIGKVSEDHLPDDPPTPESPVQYVKYIECPTRDKGE